MDKIKAYIELRRLVEKYIQNDGEKKQLLEYLEKIQYMPPVRGVIDDILKQQKSISKEDRDVINYLMHFFG